MYIPSADQELLGTLRGAIYYDASWTDTDAGIYNVSLNSPTPPTLVYRNNKIGAGSFLAGDYIYAPYLTTFMGTFSGIYVIDAETGADVRELTTTTDYKIVTATYVPEYDAALAFCVQVGSETPVLAKIQLDGTFEVIKQLGSIDFRAGMATAPDGTVYGISSTGTLYSIPPSSFDINSVGNTGVTTDYISAITYDPRNKVIVYPTSMENYCELYVVDPTTAEASLRYRFASINEFGLLYAPIEATGKAPAAVTALKATFSEGSLQGNVSFTAPSALYDGSSATGSFTYTVVTGSTTLATGSVQPGKQVNAPVTLPAKGSYKIEVYCSNDAGDGPRSETNIYAGPDTPAAVETPSLTYASGTFTLTWKPAASLNGGYIDPAAVNYKVSRIVDGTTTEVTTLTGITTFTEAWPEPTQGIQQVSYSVQPSFSGEEAPATLSNRVILGHVNPPYSLPLNSADDASILTVIDTNNDGATWAFNNSAGIGTMAYTYNPYNAADDLLILPGAKLEAGKYYQFTFKAASQNASSTETLSVLVGNQPTATGLGTTLLQPTEVKTALGFKDDGSVLAESFAVPFIPENDGIYFFAIRCTSAANMSRLFVLDMAISEPKALTCPGGIDDLVVTPDPSGAEKATITFTAHTKDLNGNALGSLSKVEILRDGELLQPLTPAIGEKVTYLDEKSHQGTVTYTVIGINESGRGIETSASAFVGISAPAAPESVNCSYGDDFGEIVLEWPPVTKDLLGHDITDVSYIITRYNRAMGQWSVVTDNITDPTYTMRLCAADAQQSFEQLGVIASNAIGDGGGRVARVVPVGASYTMPFTESFKMNTILYTSNIQGEGAWDIADDNDYQNVQSYDHDNAFAIFTGKQMGDTSRITTGRVHIDENAANPQFSFYYFCYAADNPNVLRVYIDEGFGPEQIGSDIVSGSGTTNAWTRVNIPLNNYSGKDVQFAVEVVCNGYANEIIDQMSVTNLSPRNLSISLDVPSQLTTDQALTATAVVSNIGAEASPSCSADLVVDHVAVAHVNVGALEPGTSRSVNFTYALPTDVADNIEVWARINTDVDSDWSDNATPRYNVEIAHPSLPAVTDLAFTLDDNGGADFTWSEPDLSLSGKQITESFESMAGGTNMNSGDTGDWQILDLDGKPTGGFEEVELPGSTYGSQGSFFVIDYTDPAFTGFSNTLRPSTGTKMMAALYNADLSQNNDWLISPELIGGAQTISFYARSYDPTYPETLAVYCSTTDDKPESFTLVREFAGITTDNSMSWTKYSCALPDGARYFAIVFRSADSFMVLLDDVTFTPTGAEALSPLGYNIYRSGEKMNTELLTTLTWHEDNVMPDARYSVKVVYPEGESKASNYVYPGGNAVDTIGLAAMARGLQGAIEVTGTETVEIADMQGRVIYRGAPGRIAAPAGVYIVRATRFVAKVIVR